MLFCAYLDDLEGGRHTEGFRGEMATEQERHDKYLELGYDILEYLLEPAM